MRGAIAASGRGKDNFGLLIGSFGSCAELAGARDAEAGATQQTEIKGFRSEWGMEIKEIVLFTSAVCGKKDTSAHCISSSNLLEKIPGRY